jgi:hypothetical protein
LCFLDFSSTSTTLMSSPTYGPMPAVIAAWQVICPPCRHSRRCRRVLGRREIVLLDQRRPDADRLLTPPGQNLPGTLVRAPDTSCGGVEQQSPHYTKNRGLTWQKISLPGVPDTRRLGRVHWAYYLNRHRRRDRGMPERSISTTTLTGSPSETAEVLDTLRAGDRAQLRLQRKAKSVSRPIACSSSGGQR